MILLVMTINRAKLKFGFQKTTLQIEIVRKISNHKDIVWTEKHFFPSLLPEWRAVRY